MDVVVLAGGAGRRLGGVDKAGLVVGGSSLLDRVLRATASARHTVVVGRPRPTVRPVLWTQETPPGGGPLAGLEAGLQALCDQAIPHERTEDAEHADPAVVVLATDLPQIDEAAVARLVEALHDAPEADAAVFTDAAGHHQLLTAVYRRVPLTRAIGALAPVANRRVRLLLEELTVVEVPDQGASADCDTPDQLTRARAEHDRRNLDGQG